VNTSEPIAIEETGLEYMEGVGFVDPDTGEAFSELTEGEFASKEAADKTGRYIAYCRSSLEILESQKKAIESQIRSTKRRIEWIEANYVDAYRRLVEKIMPKGKQSVFTGLLTVGYRKTTETIAVTNAATIAKIAPEATSITFDLTNSSFTSQQRKQLSILARTITEGVSIDVKVSKINDEIKQDLVSAEAIKITAPTNKWYIKS
jgi:hypothetical protein